MSEYKTDMVSLLLCCLKYFTVYPAITSAFSETKTKTKTKMTETQREASANK